MLKKIATFLVMPLFVQANMKEEVLSVPKMDMTLVRTSDLSSQVWFSVDKYQLDNGMTVLLHETHGVPLISFNIWYRVGSKDEEEGYTGIAHLFEHMMFKGAKKYSGKELHRTIQKNGGSYNAFTTHDYTGYYTQFPSDKLELAIDIEADRMQFLNLNEKNLLSEKQVVKEERRYRVDNSVNGTLFEKLFATVFKTHSYRWPVIGWMHDIENITIEKCQDFYKNYYAPNNAIVALVGDFQTETAKKLIDKYFAKIKPSSINRPPYLKEPVQKESRSDRIRREVQNDTLAIAFKAPNVGDEDGYALDLLANILSEGTSSRLQKKLKIKNQWADSLSVFNYTLKDSGLFTVYVSLKSGSKGRNKVRDIVYNEIWRSRNYLYSKKEIQRAKNQLLLEYVNSLKTISGKARLLALNEMMFGDYTRLFTDLGLYQRLTPEMIRSAAKKYLRPQQRSTIWLIGKGS